MRSIFAAFALALALIAPTHAASLLLDPELNAAFAQLANPLRSALPGTAKTRIFVLDDNTLNAFATPDGIVYLHSGLIKKVDNQEELRGVIAHELAHISSNHFLKGEAAMGQAKLRTIGGIVAGMGAAIAGAPQAGVAIMSTGQAAGIAGILQHTRVQEQEADQAARKALQNAGIATTGMASMFEKLRTESQLSYDAPPPYLLTHPMPAQRRLSVQGQLPDAPSQPIAPTDDFKRIQAKVFALTNTPATTLRTYRGADFASRYARLIATFQLGNRAETLAQLGALQKDQPNDPWLKDLEATLALQSGNPKKAFALWQPLATAYPADAVLQFQTAEAARAQEDLATAARYYRQTVRLWPDWSEAWYSYGLTLGQTGDILSSHLAMAESNYHAHDEKAAKASLALARHYAKETKPTPDQQTWLTSLTTRLKVDEEK